ncbi:MAG: helix-turn-helix transcriptional regulator, partial [Gemmiger qucibialis]
MTIGERIREARTAKGLTQEQLAEQVHVTKQAVYKYETGIVTNIPLDKLESIAACLG